MYEPKAWFNSITFDNKQSIIEDNMKKKIVIKISANCDKCRKKAMQVAAVTHGVMSVAIQGDSRDVLVVVGDGVDAACLVATLRKKACFASLETLEEVKPPPPPPPKDKPKGGEGDDKEKKKKSDTEEKAVNLAPPCHPICCHHPPYEVYNVVYDSYGPSSGCAIL